MIWLRKKKRAAKLIKLKRMTKAGMDKIRLAKENGEWGRTSSAENLEIPQEFKAALAKSKKAKTYYESLAPSYKKHFIGWISSAKKSDTRDRRIKESMECLRNGRKLGMK